MTLFHWITQLLRRTSRHEVVEHAAAEAVQLVWPQLTSNMRQMSAAERYGYIRAHATAPVTRLVARYVTDLPALARHAQPSFEQAVLEATVDLAIARLARTAPIMTTRRAA